MSSDYFVSGLLFSMSFFCFSLYLLFALVCICLKIRFLNLFCFSALLAAACPESAPFMADECLMAIPEIEGIDYTTKEYLKFVNHIQSVADRLNKTATDGKTPDAVTWSPHRVELAIWTHYVVAELQPDLLSS